MHYSRVNSQDLEEETVKIQTLTHGDIGPIDFSSFVERQPDLGTARIKRMANTSPEIFDMEMRYIFEGTWIYLCHESQIPNSGDFLTTTMGRQPVIIVRNSMGKVNGFLNACSHKGSTLCRTQSGSKPNGFACSYHDWCFDLDGTIQYMPRRDEGYPKSLDMSHYNLSAISRVESYGGFVFGSLNPTVPSLREHLGDLTEVIDMLTDQGDDGFEVIRGTNTCIYRGNWKLLVENGGGDGLHLPVVHKTLIKVVQMRDEALNKGKTKAAKMVRIDELNNKDTASNVYAMQNGHTLIQSDLPNPQDRPSYARHEEFVERYGAERARWMTSKVRQACIYPNLFIMDQLASLIRYVRPISVDQTEVSYWCIAPKGEPRPLRVKRMRQFMDFFSVAGLGGPDDNHEFEQCQLGAGAASARWSDASFGLHTEFNGPDPAARAVRVNDVKHGGHMGYEGGAIGQYSHWIKLMQEGQARELAMGRNP